MILLTFTGVGMGTGAYRFVCSEVGSGFQCLNGGPRSVELRLRPIFGANARGMQLSLKF